MDEIDLKLIGRLSRDGRATWVSLARETGLTPPAVAARVRQLVECGVIRQFAACVEPQAVGAITAFVDVTLQDADGHDRFRQAVGRLVAIQECHRVAGAAHYRLKLRTRTTEELDALLSAALPQAAPGAAFHVSMVLNVVKESPVYPLPRA